MKPLIITGIVLLIVILLLLLTFGMMRAAKRGDMMQEVINSQRNLDEAEQKPTQAGK